MRVSALEAVNNLSEKNLKLIIKTLGDEKEASKIAKNIVKYRNKKKLFIHQNLQKLFWKVKKKIMQVK